MVILPLAITFVPQVLTGIIIAKKVSNKFISIFMMIQQMQTEITKWSKVSCYMCIVMTFSPMHFL